ncbi:flavodoxin [Caloramator sp. CAR-1]|uniref:flavodoxin family protein n=2 Tax=unclassified Caloramator TaxID=2629145 RepID=UPI0026E34341|nr:flavodoxin [Caloramator sp. CAR-1]MDO6355251.1 flavodoxin [Caloramator sp. CAR-1]
MTKGAVVYFSLDGNTEFVANKITERTGFEIIKIKPLKEFKYKGFWKFFYGGKMSLFGERPEVERVPNWELYDTIFLGTPIWAGRPCPYVLSFIENHPFNEKKIYLFSTFAADEKKAYEYFTKKMNLIISDEIGFKDSFIKNKIEVEKRIENWLKGLI